MEDRFWQHYNLTEDPGESGKFECYCENVWLKAFGNYKMVESVVFRDPTTGLEETWCGEWAEADRTVKFLSYAAIGAVVAVCVYHQTNTQYNCVSDHKA